jgi:cell division protein FtsL
MRANSLKPQAFFKEAHMHGSWKLLAGILFFAIIITGISLFHVWNKYQVSLFGRQITQEIKKFYYLDEENRSLDRKISELSNTQRIETLAKGVKLMHMPKSSEVMIMKEKEDRFPSGKEKTKALSLSEDF